MVKEKKLFFMVKEQRKKNKEPRNGFSKVKQCDKKKA